MLARVLAITFALYFMVYLVESKSCACITNSIDQIRCPGSGLSGYFSGYGHCSSHNNMLSGCTCIGCSTCDD
ncbi:hypothetical protein HPULCUR_007065 [Helicostylum pulchrum]|uniref:Uncharacterized protein n=1 Tax=Helicostylum pulchrum TaxID=562976 RepID=A0ABP9Y3P9_9FUNG